MLNSINDPDYILKEYSGYIIASHKDNIATKSAGNSIVVYEKNDFPEHGFDIGLDDSKCSGARKRVAVDLSDAKAYIDWVIASRQQKGALLTSKQKRGRSL